MKILLVDDTPENLDLLEAILEPYGYELLKCEDGETALRIASTTKLDLVLLDVVMPGIDGYEVARRLKAMSQVPVILVSGMREQESVIRGFECGADEFVAKPFLPQELLLRTRNILKLKEYQNGLEDTANKRAKILRGVLKESIELNREMVSRLLIAAEYRDDNTGKHIMRVGKFSRITAERLGFRGEFLELIQNAAPMHDLGKIGIPDSILLKPGRLTKEEFEIMKTHTTIGASILRKSNFPLLKMSYDIALNHHERWDGTGYPEGKRDEEIPVPGRIVALADVFDALISRRPYKPPFSFEQSLTIIKESSGSQFDPEVINAFINGLVDIRSVYIEYQDGSPGNPVADFNDSDLRR